jgi:hypothetical protein
MDKHDILRDPRLEPMAYDANDKVRQFISALTLQAELKRKGDGPTVIAACLGGAVEIAYDLLQMPPAEFRRFLTDNILAYCDHIDPPVVDKDEGEDASA